MLLNLEGVKSGTSAIAIAMNWSKHDTVKEAKGHLKSTPNASWALRADGERLVLGVASEESGKLVSGALLFASIVQTGVLIHPLSESKTWVCAAVYGVPLPGGDAVLSTTEAREAAGQFLGFMREGRIFGVSNESLASFEELIAGRSWDKSRGEFEPALKSMLKECTLQRKTNKTAVIVGSLSLFAMLAVVGGYFALEKPAVDTGNAERARAERDKAIKAANASIAAAKEAFAKQILADRERAALGLGQGQKLINSWLAVLDRLPKSAVGYKLNGVRCTASECEASWQASGSGRARPNDKTRIPGKLVELEPSPMAKTVFPVEAQADTGIQDCDDVAALRVNFASALMAFDTGVSVAAPLAIISIAPPLPPSDIATLASFNMTSEVPKLANVELGHGGKWTIGLSKYPLSALRTIGPVLSRFAVKPSSLTVSGDFKQIQMGGDYGCILAIR